jgi:hypothetical protein
VDEWEGSADGGQERPTRKDEEVMYEEMKRCWALEVGHDEWLRPLMVTEEETRKMERRAKRVIVRGVGGLGGVWRDELVCFVGERLWVFL